MTMTVFPSSTSRCSTLRSSSMSAMCRPMVGSSSKYNVDPGLRIFPICSYDHIRKMRKPGSTLYLLEEPTIGLHMADIELLLKVLHRLVDEGNTVIVIEHNLSVIAEADYIVDLGPEAGPDGGKIVAVGTPEQVAKNRTSRTAPFLRKTLAQSGADRRK